jgi:hypothetical protein
MIVVRNVDRAIPGAAVPNMDESVLSSIVGNVTTSTRNHWIKLAESDKSSFKGDYIRSIQPAVAKSGTEHVVSLVGDVAHLLEDGAPKLDMRTTLLGPDVPVVPVAEQGQDGDDGQRDKEDFQH